jgi:hypothetical protein
LCSGYFGNGSLQNYLPGLVSNREPPDLSLPNNYDYRPESKRPGEDF